jgi:hypothetical protein
MNPKTILQIDSSQRQYVRSIRDPDRRRFAHAYVDWLMAGRVGLIPEKGRLSTDTARLLVLNIEALG